MRANFCAVVYEVLRLPGKAAEIPCWTRIVLDFHRITAYCKCANYLPLAAKPRKLEAGMRSAKSALPHCTFFGHPPVTGLHSIENARDKITFFLLTAKLKSVELNRSLTVS